MRLKGRKAMLDDIYLEPGNVYFRSIQVKLKNKETKNYVGKYGGNDKGNIKVKGLAGIKISKVSFLVKKIDPGLQYYSGIRIYDDEGSMIENHGTGLHWIDYELMEDEYISGIWG